MVFLVSTSPVLGAGTARNHRRRLDATPSWRVLQGLAGAQGIRNTAVFRGIHESWTIKVECGRTDAFEVSGESLGLQRSNQSILKEFNLE